MRELLISISDSVERHEPADRRQLSLSPQLTGRLPLTAAADQRLTWKVK